jgi:hypothetical protein
LAAAELRVALGGEEAPAVIAEAPGLDRGAPVVDADLDEVALRVAIGGLRAVGLEERDHPPEAVVGLGGRGVREDRLPATRDVASDTAIVRLPSPA